MERAVRDSLTTAGKLALAVPLPATLVLSTAVVLHPTLSVSERFVGGLAVVATLAASTALALFLRRSNRLLASVDDDSAEKSRQLTHDEGTGALLRRFFLNACEKKIAADGETPTAYFAVDMDFLKQLNDSLGHQAGDAALRQLVAVIRARFPDALIGRLGGDEFAFLAPCTDEDMAVQMAAALLADLAKPFKLGGNPLALSATIGTALLPHHTRFIAEAVQFSDLALYEGKRNGRNRATLFSRKMLSDFRRERQIEREILVGLEREQFTLVYQPMSDAKGTLVALRAIVDWESAWLGRIDRALYMKVAETSTLIDRLGRWAIDGACADAARFGDTPVCIPVSMMQLRRDDILVAMASALERSKIAPHRIILELEGSERLANDREVTRRLQALAESGVHLSSDSFWPLFAEDERQAIPMRYVRIAARYVAALGAGGRESVIVASVAMLAQQAGISVVAEGVETEEAALIARAASCEILAPSATGPTLTADAVCNLLPMASNAKAA